MKDTRPIEQVSAKTRVRAVHLRTSGASLESRPDGAMLVRADEPLGEYPRVLTERLLHWARVAPDRVFAAKRRADGEWRYLTYVEALRKVRGVGQAFLDRGLSEQRPVAILSENDLEHLVLVLAGLHVGVPTASIAPAYSLVSTDFQKLKHVVKTLSPGLVFVSNGPRYHRALQATLTAETEVTFAEGRVSDRNAIPFGDLAATTPTAAVDTAHAAIGADDIAKFLFSSGSTGLPKAVINTHRMICSNQQMILQGFRFLSDAPPVIVDWLPWNHTAGGNHQIGMILYNGGTLYIDDGRPTEKGIATTVRNLREIAPTVYFNVPRGYEDLLPFFRSDAQLRENFFSRLKFMFYAGAGLSQQVWDAYRNLLADSSGERVMMATGLGATETSPMALQCTWESEQTGAIGIPMPGVEAKIVPVGDKLEIRVKGPNVTPGYWHNPELSRAAFDEEGYYKFGDAVRFVDPHDVNKGFIYDGRLAEDFKLASGTWVSVGPLRAQIIRWFAPYARDVVITGHDCDFLGMLLLPDTEACRSLAPDAAPGTPPADILRQVSVTQKFASLLESFAARATGSSNRIERAVLLEEPLSIDAGEITDKGSLNQRAIIERRSALVEEMHGVSPSAHVLRVLTKP
jgi:feruloyl-CoA synthase